MNSIQQKNAFNSDKIGPNSFLVHGLIGKGSFGEVYLVEKSDQGKLYAMKVLHKSKINKQNLGQYAMSERNILSYIKHPFIVHLYFAFQTQDKLFLILQYCPGGDLGELLKKEKKFCEEKTKFYLSEIILALEFLHQKDIIFRDLKPDNIVLDYEGHVMITDFGLSKEGIIDQCIGAKSFCGSYAYLAPEMLKQTGHGKAVDWYLLGVLMYELLIGEPPFYTSNKDILLKNIEGGKLNIPEYLSLEAKSILKSETNNEYSTQIYQIKNIV
ncbi:protein kinase domain protein [Ichthyophthirius multifiliis]|uniref:non-specific serine/threonine protein kinase n=1 Tax=Ichthyophthirius multifiliis TaxID=5932 RepID=G0QXJ4_ICHMU|nr:protein kinase domain protein [Ichthyophthirius multifiliis]EGR30060.1 protein kinase domain protein [Ichthyophthirius multifiliis]|eukprot:XP_004031296.1 protein kinase domain protein [Ichthyophthirius multifiliis]